MPARPQYRKPEGVSRVARFTARRTAVPLDYSFKELETMADVVTAEPVSGRRRRIPGTESPKSERAAKAGAASSTATAGHGGGGGESVGTGGAKKKRKRRPPPTVTALRLCNNHLEDLVGFEDALDEILDEPSELAWLDLSFNELTAIDEVITFFPHLTTLYLHGNNIADLDEVRKLAYLPFLTSLTLHGNPCEERNGFQQFVLATLPELRHLNFSAVTPTDRSAALTWHGVNKKRIEARRRRKAEAAEAAAANR